MNHLKEFEQKVQDWLDLTAEERNLEAGAMLMLQANKNRILYTNVVNKKNFAKIVYELEKYLGSKLRKCDTPTVKKLQEEIATISKEMPADNKGKRADHDELPQEVQDVIFNNSEKYARLRALHERVKVLSGNGYTACDRFPYLKEMLELSTEIRDSWKFYDEFVIGTQDEVIHPKPIVIDTQRIGSNRVYIGRAIKEVALKYESGKVAQASAQIAEAQVRYNELIQAGQEVKPETIEGLKGIGVIVQEIGTKADDSEPGEELTDTENSETDPAKTTEADQEPKGDE